MKSLSKGAILVTTLWILSLLTLLAIGIGIRTGVDIKLIGYFLNSSKAHYIALAGVRKTIVFLQADNNKNVDSLNEMWACGYDFDEEKFVLKEISLGDGQFSVSYIFGRDAENKPIYLYGACDEEGKLNINKLDADMLAMLPGFSDEIVAAVIDWRDTDDLLYSYNGAQGAEEDYYKELDTPYECKNAPFSAPEELLMVRGVTEEIYNEVKDIITVYGGDGAVNINTASEKVLAVLAGYDHETLPAKILKFRNGSDEIPGTEDDRVFMDADTIVVKLKDPVASGGLDAAEQAHLNDLIVNKKCFKVKSGAFRIFSHGSVKDGRVKNTIEAVVKRQDNNCQILYYYED